MEYILRSDFPMMPTIIIEIHACVNALFTSLSQELQLAPLYMYVRIDLSLDADVASS